MFVDYKIDNHQHHKKTVISFSQKQFVVIVVGMKLTDYNNTKNYSYKFISIHYPWKYAKSTNQFIYSRVICF